MSQRIRLLPVVVSLTSLFVSVAMGADPPAKNAGESARWATYQKPSGDGYFALSLAPALPDTHASGRDVVVLFDTSASQTGAYREDARTALSSLLAGLTPDDRVKLYAVDLNAVALTDKFVAPGSDALQAGLAKLDQRAPLGSTDMAGAFTAAAGSFVGEPTAPRTVIYIGDGVSRGRLLGTEAFGNLMKDLAARRTTISSYAVGPQTNVALLAATANHTGGVVLAGGEESSAEGVAQGLSAQQIGDALAASVRATVAWPTKVELPAAVKEAYPTSTPPLRSDRDSVIIGKLSGKGVDSVSITVDVAGGSRELTWNLRAGEASSEEFSFLPRLVEVAQGDNGWSLPTVGSEGLRESGRMVLAAADDLTRIGQQALAGGDKTGAKQAAQLAIKADPDNPVAKTLISAATKNTQPVAVGSDDPELKVGDKPAAGAPAAGGPAGKADPAPGGLLRQFDEEGGEFLDKVQADRRVLAQKVQADVDRTLSVSRQKMGDDPESATLTLKVLLEDVERAVEVDADIRQQLRNKIEGVLKEAGRRAAVVAEQKAKEAANRATAIEAQKLVEATERRGEKVKQLMERFSALMDEKRYKEAEDEIAMQVREIEPDNSTAMAAAWSARNSFHIRENERLFELRHANFSNALFQVELSHIPFPDEPPIVYPKAEIWEKLTRDREKYKSVDLARRGGAEERILKALQNTTNLEYVETPLKEVVDDLARKHNIPIELDKKALEAAGTATETPVNKTLKGISLRSGMRLLLKEFDLTYVVRDEVLLITTKDEAEKALITKVYPVADLVIPVISGGGNFGVGGGGGFGGGGGGLGGGGGGFGGG
ncbi:MAG TPA: hypothetical protein PLV92_09645, partial [Pirellulaceae bacterium]|nr:hypothetical protein [Pirellulaceae bacterium]